MGHSPRHERIHSLLHKRLRPPPLHERIYPPLHGASFATAVFPQSPLHSSLYDNRMCKSTSSHTTYLLTPRL